MVFFQLFLDISAIHQNRGPYLGHGLPLPFLFIKMLVPISKHTVVAWVFGSIFGLSVSLLTINLIQHPNYKWSILHKSDKSAFHGHAHSHRDLEYEVGPDDIVVFHKNDSVHHKDEDLVAREMAGRVRVLCWVMTQPENHRSKVR